MRQAKSRREEKMTFMLIAAGVSAIFLSEITSS